MNGYAVIIKANVTPRLDDRQLAVVSDEAHGTIAYDSATGALRFTATTPDPDADMVIVLRYGAETVTRAVRAAGATADIREGRVITWEDYEAETFRPRAALAGAAEAADLLGVTRQRLADIRKMARFPQPVADLKAGPVWDRAEIERFSNKWDRKAGRPAKTTREA